MRRTDITSVTVFNVRPRPIWWRLWPAVGLFALVACGSGNETAAWNPGASGLGGSLPLSATRAGALSPIQDDSMCLAHPAAGARQVTLAPCSANPNAAWTVANRQLASDANVCLSITGAQDANGTYPVAAAACRAGDANQTFGFIGGRYIWGPQDGRFCLDAAPALAASNGTGALRATACSIGNKSQLWTMHSRYADTLASAPLGRYGKAFLPRVNGFLSTDGSATVGLGFGRSAMFTADTFVNTAGGTDPNAWNSFVHNAVGLIRCTDLTQPSTCTIRFFYGNHGRTQPIYATTDSAYIWPTDAVISNGEILSTCNRTITVGNTYHSDGSGMCRVLNPLDTPDLWERQFQTISHDPNHSLSPHMSVNPSGVIGPWSSSDNGLSYSYATYANENGTMAVRLPFSAQQDPRTWIMEGSEPSAWQYLNAKDAWTPLPAGGKPLDAKTHVAPYLGGNVNWDPDKRIYSAVSFIVGKGTGPTFTKASTIVGSWNGPTIFTTLPEYTPTSPDYAPSAFCYAAEPHPELSPPGQLVFSYFCGHIPTFRIVPVPW